MAASRSPEREADRLTRGRIAAQWFSVVGPPIAAFGHQQLSYMFVDEACRRHAPLIMHLPSLLAVAVTGAAARLALREWDRAGHRLSPDDSVIIGSPRFFAALGMILSGLALGLILAQWLPVLFLHPCQR
jgi:hypothetical protein